MEERVDKKGLLDKLGVPPGTIDERELWLYNHVSDVSIGEEQSRWLSKLNEYTKATTDPDACWLCGNKKAEGYLEKAHFVREQTLRRLRELCDEWPDRLPVCAACGEKRRLDAEKPDMGFRFIDKIFHYVQNTETVPAKICYCIVFCTIPFWFTLATVGKIGRGLAWMYCAFRDERRRRKYQQC